MSAPTLDRTLDLMGRVLELEQRQGYRNASATGGLYRYFANQFGDGGYDDISGPFVHGLLQAFKRYEAAPTVDERRVQLQVILRRLEQFRAGAAESTREEPHRPVSPAHRGDAPALEAVRAGNRPHVDVPPAKRADGPSVPEGHNGRPHGDPAPTAAPPAVKPPAPAPATVKPPVPAPIAASLDQPLHTLLKIRSQEAEKLDRLGVLTVEDALYYLPRDHYDCRNPVPINKIRAGMTTTLVCTLQAVSTRRTARQQTLVEAKLADETGIIRITWFSQFMAPLLRPHIGQRIAVSGRAEIANGHLQFVPRDYEFPDEDESTHTGRLVPIYPLTEGLSQRWMRKTIRSVVEAGAHLVTDPIPSEITCDYALPALPEALRAFHFPEDEAAKSAGARRLAFDELLYISIGMARRKRAWQSAAPAHAIARDESALDRFLRALPFALTGAQRRALEAILSDMARPMAMNRLLQGDVGSGKTVVAAAALYLTAMFGLQGAIMAPTEILAEQHARSFIKLLEPLGVRVALLTGSIKGAERARVYAGMASGEIGVIIGTHALIQEGVAFERLGMAVIDEQHRFGVEQRGQLRQKGFNPHVLAMTATPIPRTLSLTIFGDLDVSTIDERPPGRQPIETTWELSEAAAFRRVREQVAAGRQAYVICPLVEESEKLEAKAAVAEFKRLQEKVFPDLRVGLVHGKLKPAEKEAALARFRDAEIDILVATSVVEVGIDVPNATVMVVEEANHFGLAQLHQFRGRVGRGAERSYCILLAESVSGVGQQRLQAITSTDDGFKLAEIDLELRGAGDFWGTRQSGLPELKVAGLGDTRTIEEARDAAMRIVAADPELTRDEHRLLAQKVEQFWNRASERS